MKKVFLFLLSLLLATSAFITNAELKFKDMPDDHWAARSVYNVVRLGITRGYPDGTFRGDKKINRYELMVFLSNLAIAMEQMMDDKIAAAQISEKSSANTLDDKLLAELKAEIDTLRASVIAYQQAQVASGLATVPPGDDLQKKAPAWKRWIVSGSYTFRANTFKVTANTLSTDYISQRARLTLGQVSNRSGVLFEIDTGYSNPALENIAANITNNVLAVRAWTETDAFWDSTLLIEGTAGPGDFELNDVPSNGVLSPNGTVIYRPGNTMRMKWALFDFDVIGRYEKRKNNIDRSMGKLGYSFSLEEWGWGNIYCAIGSEVYSCGGYVPTNSPRSIYELKYEPLDWLTLAARGTRLVTFVTDKIEYYSESSLKCIVPSTETEIVAEVDRLSNDFYVDSVSDEIIAVNLLGYKVLPGFESSGFGVKQYFFDKRTYLAGYNNISTSMLTDRDKIYLFQENATQVEAGWNITPEASLSILGRNTYYRIFNDPVRNDLDDHLISGQFNISF